MKKELEKTLIEMFPTYFRDMYGDPQKTCMAFGCEIDDGWYQLLFDLCIQIERTNPPLDFHFSQIKEKFGTLRIYFENGNKEISNLIDQAEEKSALVCERCGTKDNVTSEGNWILTLCKECRGKK